MYKIDEDIISTVKAFLNSPAPKATKTKRFAKTTVKLSPTGELTVTYLDDGYEFDPCTHQRIQVRDPEELVIFWAWDKAATKFDFNDCGWPTRTTKCRLNSCFAGAGLPLQVFVRKRAFWVRNTKTQAEWLCGDGLITSQELAKHGVL